MWAIGCLLFAWFYGYSPFESQFVENGSLRVVECSHVRILSKVPVPPKMSPDDRVIAQLCEGILIHDINNRPFTHDIIKSVEEKLFSKNGDSFV